MYLHLVPNGKITMGPLWDFDLSFGNVDYADSRYTDGYWIKEHAWYQRLFQDPTFVRLVKERFMFFIICFPLGITLETLCIPKIIFLSSDI